MTLRTGKSISVGFPNVLITLRRDEKPSRRSVMSTIIDSPVLTPSPPTFAHRMPGYILDGSSVSMPDTPANQAMYPQPPNQKPGLGFPLARITVLLSLATGACHDLAIAPYA